MAEEHGAQLEERERELRADAAGDVAATGTGAATSWAAVVGGLAVWARGGKRLGSSAAASIDGAARAVMA